MVDNQHEKITGYRDLNEEEIALMNEGKALATQVGDYIDKLASLRAQIGTTNVDPRWVSIARTHLQQGFMAAIRSIARPTTF